MRVTLDFPAAEEILQEVGLDEQGDTQMFHTKNVLRRIQKYMPYRTGATIKLTVAQTDPRVPEIVTEEPQAVVPPPAAQCPLRRAVQGRRRGLQLLQKGFIFLIAVHGFPSSPSSRRSNCNARRWRVAAVPWGMFNARAVSAWVYPAK